MFGCQKPTLVPIEFDWHKYEFVSDVDLLLKQTNDGGQCASRYSYIAAYDKVLQARDVKADTILPVSKETWNVIQQDFKFVDGAAHILEQAKDHEIVMFNEAHPTPQHRAFVAELLPKLAKEGFTHLALETLNVMDGATFDTALVHRGFPSFRTGFYTKEPVFGNLVRTAIDNGFTIFGYDEGRGVEREITGAKNILKNITQPSGALRKTIVLCGWDHIRETNTQTYWEFALAGRLREYTGKDPLTIEQTRYSERSKRMYEDSVYQHVNIQTPSILIDKSGASFDVEKDPYWYDIMLFHPRTNFSDGIPDWVATKEELQSIEIPEIEINCPCKVFLYDEDDDVKVAIPRYMKEMATLQKQVTFPRFEGLHKIVISNKEQHFMIKY